MTKVASGIFTVALLYGVFLGLNNSNNGRDITLLSLSHATADANSEDDDDDCDNSFFSCNSLWFDVLTDDDCDEERCFNIIVYSQCDTYHGKVNECQDGGPDFCYGGRCII